MRQYVIPTGAGMGRGLVNHDPASRDPTFYSCRADIFAKTYEPV